MIRIQSFYAKKLSKERGSTMGATTLFVRETLENLRKFLFVYTCVNVYLYINIYIYIHTYMSKEWGSAIGATTARVRVIPENFAKLCV